jgi:[ribosomal protein S5]-alanine N-acetyltransferase
MLSPNPTTTVIATERLIMRRMTPDDAPFVVTLVNDADWIRFIGDRNVHSEDDARAYLKRTYLAMYEKHGYGLYLVLRRDDDVPIGMCGVLKREGLEEADIGFAFLPAYRGHGYALEAARASLDYARDTLKLKSVVAITLPENRASIALLEKIGLQYVKRMRLADDADELALYETRFDTN